MANKRRSLDVQLVAARWLEIGSAPRRATPFCFGALPRGSRSCGPRYVENVPSENNTACHGGYCSYY